VGIWAEHRANLHITNVVVEDCQVGIVMIRGAHQSGDALQPSSMHVEGAKVRASTIGIFLGGDHGTASNNIVGGARYGIVVTGDDNTITANQSNDNFEDGFLVTGHRNLLEGNAALRNGGIGIHVARVVPMVGDHRFLSFIQDRGTGNVISGNTALHNGVDLVEFADCVVHLDGSLLENEWINNVFSTRSPSCIM
jgi:Periplasmic copper-binding protein (NosD)